MKIGTKVFILINFVIVCYLVNFFITPIKLLFEDGKTDAIPVSELLISDDVHRENTNKHVVPKIIHQTYKTAEIPEQWKETQKSCLELHPDYKYILWTDEMSRDFIEKEYPTFLKTFDGYKNNIQRADSIRYFVLHKYGGIYLDLDDGCERRLDVLLQYPAWLRRTIPTGISNDAMGSVPGHPFFKKTIERLTDFDKSFGMPYITVMASTGPLFLSMIWKQYKRDDLPPDDHVRVLMPDEYKGQEWSMFHISKGNSWHGKDAQTIFWMGRHWLLLTVTGFAVAGVVFTLMFWGWQKYVVRKGRGGKGGSYELVSQQRREEEGRIA